MAIPRPRLALLPSRETRRGLYPVYAVGMSALMVVIDFLAGPFVQFPFAFILPVAFAAWFCGRGWGLALAIVLPLVRLYFVTLWNVPWDFEYSLLNAGIRVAVLGIFALLIDRVARQERELARRVDELEGLLPICSGCKKIRDEEDVWQPVDLYITERSRAQFTHGFCPTCAKQYFGEYAEE